LPESRPSCAAEAQRTELLVTKLARFYSVVGHRPDELGALALMAEMLTQSATDDEINAALSRCARECRYPVRIPDILQRVPGKEVPQLEAQARKAWDVVTAFVAKYVSNDVYGNYGPEHGWYDNFPKLSDRILDTVRRTGGWKIYRCMTDENFPFVQKRFFEEYEAWTAVERLDATELLTQIPILQLIGNAKAMNAAPHVETLPPVRLNKIPAPLTAAQIRDRREILRQQAERCRSADRPSRQAELGTPAHERSAPVNA
jgi:hypothetical protein